MFWLGTLAFMPSPKQLVSAPVRGYEIQWRGNDYAHAPDPLRLQANGFDRIIVRVFSDDEKGGGLYFNNPAFKTVRPVLDAWAPYFQGGKVELWAWMGSRYFRWLKDVRILDHEWQKGQKRIIPRLDLFNPDAEQTIVSMFKELAAKPVQGILIQDDLVLRRGEGFSNWGRAHFTRKTGLAADEAMMRQAGSTHNLAWQTLKCERVGYILQTIIQACKAVNPPIKMAMNIHYELASQPQQARSWYAHDPETLAASGLDYFYLMAYHRQIRSELNLDENASRLYFVKMTTAALERFGARLVVKLQGRDWQTSAPIPLEELKAYYDLIPAGVER
ncbi:MAG: hypothetical protein JXI33_09380, partial [Candidatus Aminicenantes bacterium]|nr:hypothetical protein [Candidatus Aminicenantes bacterium]